MQMRSTTDVEDALRAFYQDVLGGEQVWPTRIDDAGGSLWFLVGSDLLEVRVGGGDAPAPAVLTVEAPEEVAERCWDAGFLVHVRDDASSRTVLSVVDPLGRRIDLSARAATRQRRDPERMAHVTKVVS